MSEFAMLNMRLSMGLIASLLLPAAPAWTHHSFAAQFDRDKPVELRGVVTKIDWMNPHVYFYIDVKDDATGEIQNWALEMGPPHQLQRLEWKRNTMQIGDLVIVEGSRARDGSHLANARKVTLAATGQVLGAASSEAQTIGRQ